MYIMNLGSATVKAPGECRIPPEGPPTLWVHFGNLVLRVCVKVLYWVHILESVYGCCHSGSILGAVIFGNSHMQ